jgi:hypothetical protein
MFQRLTSRFHSYQKFNNLWQPFFEVKTKNGRRRCIKTAIQDPDGDNDDDNNTCLLSLYAFDMIQMI